MPESARLNILLVEDGLANQRLAVALLSKWGHDVQVAADGKEGLDLFLGESQFDLILMDLQMPVMDGIEATREIRSAEQATGERIPILAMTARNLPDDRRECREAGMDGYLVKPVRQHEFHEAISRCIPDFDGPSHVDPSKRKPRNSLINWLGALENVDSDTGILSSVIEASLEELPLLTSKIDEELQTQNLKEVQRLAHTIKSSARAFCSSVLTDHAFTLELAAGSGDLPGAQKAYEAVKQLVQQFLAELTQRGADLR